MAQRLATWGGKLASKSATSATSERNKLNIILIGFDYVSEQWRMVTLGQIGGLSLVLLTKPPFRSCACCSASPSDVLGPCQKRTRSTWHRTVASDKARLL